MKWVSGNGGGEEERRLLDQIDAWHDAGDQRLDADGDNLYEHGAAVALFDQWWPLFVRDAFESPLGADLFAKAGGGVPVARSARRRRLGLELVKPRSHGPADGPEPPDGASRA